MKEEIKKIVGKDVVVHIKTLEQLNKLNEVVRELGIGTLSTNYSTVIKRGDFCVHILSSGCLWSDRAYYIKEKCKIIEFEDLCKNNTIVIYQKGNQVIALDKRNGKKAVAKCDHRDTFDFNIGAKLAFERLSKNVTFRVLAIKAYGSFLTKGKIYEFVDGKTTWDNGMISSKYDNYTHLVNHNRQWGDGVLIELKDGDNSEEILKKYDAIKEGDTVTVIAKGKTYSYYSVWLEHYVKDINRYKWDMGHSPDNGSIGKVVLVAPHKIGLANNDDLIALIDIDGRYYIIDLEGLEKIHKEDTYGIFD